MDRAYLPFQNIMDASLKYYRDLIMYAQLECDNVRPIVEKRQLLVHVICLHPQGIVDASLGSSLAPPFAFASNLALLSVDSLVNESPVVGWLLHLRHLLRDFLVYQRVQDLSVQSLQYETLLVQFVVNLLCWILDNYVL